MLCAGTSRVSCTDGLPCIFTEDIEAQLVEHLDVVFSLLCDHVRPQQFGRFQVFIQGAFGKIGEVGRVAAIMMNISPDKPGLHRDQKEVKPVDERSPVVAELHLGESLRILSKQQRIESVFVKLIASGSAPDLT